MKVLMTTDTVGGVWNYALELVRGLERCDVEVVLATLGAPLSADQRAAVRALPNLECHESRYRLEWMDAPWDDVEAAGTWLLRLATDVQPDVVHLNQYAYGVLRWPAPVLVTGHSCVLSWWEAVRRKPVPAAWSQYRSAVTAGLHGADCVVAPTRAMLAALERHYGPLPSALVIANARDPERYAPAVKQPFILAAGRLWDEAKNIEAVARVARRLHWPVYLAGEVQAPDGGRKDYPGVHSLGPLSEDALAGWLARAAVVVLPARYEPFGLTALEAGLSGCALVLGDIPSLREVWEEAALYVPPEDDEALYRTLATLTHQTPPDSSVAEEGVGGEPCATWARKARLQALNYTPERMTTDYLAAYCELLDTPHATRTQTTQAAQ